MIAPRASHKRRLLAIFAAAYPAAPMAAPMSTAPRALLLLLALAACREAPPPTATPEPKFDARAALAGFDGPVPDDDPVALEGTRLTNGPLRECAEREAVDMQQEGDLIATKLAPGQLFEQEFRLQPGRCYTLVAVAGDGIAELDATFETFGPARSKTEILASDAATGTTAVIGGGAACFPWKPEQSPIAAKFVLRAGQGSGVAVSQLYSRESPPPPSRR